MCLDRCFRPVDALFNKVYGSELNPLYKSGALAVTFLLLTLITGVYLFILYQIADPYGSVARLDATWHGSLMRSFCKATGPAKKWFATPRCTARSALDTIRNPRWS